MNRASRIRTFGLIPAIVIATALMGASGAVWAKKTKESTAAKETKEAKEAGEPNRYGVFVYSNLCIDKDSGNIFGQRIVLHRYADGDMLTFEFSQGSLGWPQFAERVAIDPKTRIAKFVAWREKQRAELSAKLWRDGGGLYLNSDFSGELAKPKRLPLVKDFSKKWPECVDGE
jgi:hypothetical protein